MQTVTIVGLGRVGMSMGLALRSWIAAPEASNPGRASLEVVGFDFDVGAQKAAERLKAVDRTQWSLGRAVRDAALVVLAVPSRETPRLMQELGPLLADEAIVTDTAPHKQLSLQWATDYLPKHTSFIAGHPVLPTNEQDPPSADLFADRLYGLFPHPRAQEGTTEVVVGLVQAIGAQPYFADPAEHDAQVAATTMLPALAASALMHTVSLGGGWRDLKNMATGDLAEATRLASMDPNAITDMVKLSPAEAIRWLDDLTARLQELRDLARRDDSEATERLNQFFADAQKSRHQWLQPEAPPEERKLRSEARGHFSRLFLGGMRRPKRDG